MRLRSLFRVLVPAFAPLLILSVAAPVAAAPAEPLKVPAAPLHLHTGALLLSPPADAPRSRLWTAVAFQLGSTETLGWGHTTSNRGGVILGGEYLIPRTGGLAVGGSLAVLELLDDHVVIPPAISEHETRLDLGATRIYARYLIGDSTTERGKWMPGTKALSTQLSAYLRFTLPTATSVLSRQRHPRPPLRDALGDGVNDMAWAVVELGASFGLVAGKWYSAWLAYTPFFMGIVPDGAHHPFFQALHLHQVVRLPWQLPGKGAFEILCEVAGFFRFPGQSDATLYPGLAHFAINPGMRYRLEHWAFSVGAKIGFGDWAPLGDRYTIGLEVAHNF